MGIQEDYREILEVTTTGSIPTNSQVWNRNSNRNSVYGRLTYEYTIPAKKGPAVAKALADHHPYYTQGIVHTFENGRFKIKTDDEHNFIVRRVLIELGVITSEYEAKRISGKSSVKENGLKNLADVKVQTPLDELASYIGQLRSLLGDKDKGYRTDMKKVNKVISEISKLVSKENRVVVQEVLDSVNKLMNDSVMYQGKEAMSYPKIKKAFRRLSECSFNDYISKKKAVSMDEDVLRNAKMVLVKGYLEYSYG